MSIGHSAHGVWVRLTDPPADVLLTPVAAAELGFTPAHRPQAATPAAPLEAHLAVTGRCNVGCAHCYADATMQSIEPSFAQLAERLRELAARGASTVAFGGGEALLRSDLGELGALARTLGLAPVLTTSGVGMTRARAAELRQMHQVNVSFDGSGADYADLRKVDRSRAAVRAIALLVATGVRVGVNVVLSRMTWPKLSATLEAAHNLGAAEGQLLRLKPTGRADSLDYVTQRLHRDQVAEFPDRLAQLSVQFGGRLALRIDCALVPFLVQDARFTPAQLQAAGIYGCEADRNLLAVLADGRHAPCSFLSSAARSPDAAPPSPAELPAPCSSCEYRAICRGGCRVVTQSRALPGTLPTAATTAAPDPECPRVERLTQIGMRALAALPGAP